jgi:ABC-2 type transport system permease protein
MHSLRTRNIKIATVARAELQHLFRDRLTRSLLLLVPAVQLLLFGYTANHNPKAIPIAIQSTGQSDQSNTDPVLSMLTQTVEATGYFKVLSHSDQSVHARVSNREALIGIEWSADALSFPPALTLTLTADASDPAAVRPALLALQSALWKQLAGGGSTNSIRPSLNIEWLYNPEGRSAWSIVPGLIGVIVMITTLLLGSLALVRERESGAWQNLCVAPLRASDVLVGKLIPLLGLAVCQTLLVLLLAHWLFELPIRGSILALLLASMLFASAHLALGFLISLLVVNQLQAIQAAVFFYLPSMLLSGFMFPFEGMPVWAQRLAETLPLTHFVRVARGVLLRGEGMTAMAGEMGAVILFTAVFLAASIAFFRRQTD